MADPLNIFLVLPVLLAAAALVIGISLVKRRDEDEDDSK